MRENFARKVFGKKMKIYPSMLSANPCCFGDELRELVDADGIHWDIMDGRFVDAITFGADVVRAHREITDQVFDVHLMVENPEKHIKNFADAGADVITVHAEATKHLHYVLNMIRSFGKRAGVALNPATSPEFIPYIIDSVDKILVMTVNPGRAGQSFLYSQIEKIQKISEMVSSDVEICVDGGINNENIKECEQVGADSCVVGSYIFRSDNYAESIKFLRESF